jgi:glycosyltransferase involved in cell wall biosynthesis
MNAPKISVIIPTLNSVQFIGEAIDSVLKQSVPVSEILLVDGGSRDGTVEMARKIGRPVQVLSQEGRGRPGARNTGLRRAAGDFIALLDSDDLWVPGKLAAQLDFFQKHPEVEMVFGDMALFKQIDDPDEPEILDAKVHDYLRRSPVNAGQLLECLFAVNFIPTSSVVFRKSCLQTVGFMNEQFLHCEDYEYWLRFAANSQTGYLEQVLVRRRMHDANAMNDAYIQNCEATIAILNQWRKWNGLTRNASQTLLRRLVLVQYNLSSHLLKCGRSDEGYDHLRQIKDRHGKIPIWLRLKIMSKTLLAKTMRKRIEAADR